MATSGEIKYKTVQPEKGLTDFVKCFWHLHNETSENKVATILPDGYFDVMFYSPNKPDAKVYLSGLQTAPVEYIVPVNASTFAISFKLPAAEYLLKTNIASFVNKGTYLPGHSWAIAPSSFSDINSFALRLTEELLPRVDKSIDPRKKILFDLLYAAGGDITVQEIANSIHWSSRQINRYFKNWFGIPLKEYCGILRYRASFEHIKDGHLYPGGNYYDQAHFIREIKKYSGVTPKALEQNKNDRFIQFSTLPKE